jgi:hypothetical protein
MQVTNISKKVLDKVQNVVLEIIENAPTQAVAAEQLGITSGQVTFFKNADWTNISEATFNKIKHKFKINDWGTYATLNFGLGITVAQATKEDSCMVGLIGETGFGKTHLLTTFAKKQPDTYYALCDTEMTKYSFLRELCKVVGVRNYAEYSKSDMINSIVRTLTRDGKKPLLILDDVGKLSDANLRLIQIVYDRTEFQCGILLAGMPYLKANIERKAAKDLKGFQELQRRIKHWEELKALKMQDVQLVCTENGITDESAINYLARECTDFGTLRNMISDCLKFAAKKSEKPSAELLTTMNKNRRR